MGSRRYKSDRGRAKPAAVPDAHDISDASGSAIPSHRKLNWNLPILAVALISAAFAGWAAISTAQMANDAHRAQQADPVLLQWQWAGGQSIQDVAGQTPMRTCDFSARLWNAGGAPAVLESTTAHLRLATDDASVTASGSRAWAPRDMTTPTVSRYIAELGMSLLEAGYHSDGSVEGPDSALLPDPPTIAPGQTLDFVVRLFYRPNVADSQVAIIPPYAAPDMTDLLAYEAIHSPIAANVTFQMAGGAVAEAGPTDDCGWVANTAIATP